MSSPEPQPTLSDGVVTLRAWRDEDIEAAIAGHDEEIAHWFGSPQVRPSYERHKEAVEAWHRAYAEGRSVVAFVIEADGEVVGSIDVRDVGEHTGEITWVVYAGHRRRGYATRAARLVADYALGELGYTRVQAKVEPENTRSTRPCSSRTSICAIARLRGRKELSSARKLSGVSSGGSSRSRA